MRHYYRDFSSIRIICHILKMPGHSSNTLLHKVKVIKFQRVELRSLVILVSNWQGRSRHNRVR